MGLWENSECFLSHHARSHLMVSACQCSSLLTGYTGMMAATSRVGWRVNNQGSGVTSSLLNQALATLCFFLASVSKHDEVHYEQKHGV